MKWTEALVVDALREVFLPSEPGSYAWEEWAMLTQVMLRTPKVEAHRAYRNGSSKWAANERTIDVFLVRTYASGIGFDRLAVEVKVSRADYRNETDTKRAPAWASAHRCCYAAPVGLIEPSSLPAGWGLIEVHEEPTRTGRPVGNHMSRCTWRRTATRHEPACDLDYLISAGFRRASRAEHRITTAGAEDPEAEAARLRDENTRLAAMLERARTAQSREMARAKAARAELLALEGAQECADCEQPVTFKRGGRGDSTWVHVDAAAEEACYQARRERDRLRREAATGAEYVWGFGTPTEPAALRRFTQQQTSGQEAS